MPFPSREERTDEWTWASDRKNCLHGVHLPPADSPSRLNRPFLLDIHGLKGSDTPPLLITSWELACLHRSP